MIKFSTFNKDRNAAMISAISSAIITNTLL